MTEIAAPEVQFLDAEIVARAGFVRGQQADRNSEHDFGLAPGNPADGVRAGQGFQVDLEAARLQGE